MQTNLQQRPNDDGDWQKYAKLVLTKLEENDECAADLQKSISSLPYKVFLMLVMIAGAVMLFADMRYMSKQDGNALKEAFCTIEEKAASAKTQEVNINRIMALERRMDLIEARVITSMDEILKAVKKQ